MIVLDTIKIVHNGGRVWWCPPSPVEGGADGSFIGTASASRNKAVLWVPVPGATGEPQKVTFFEGTRALLPTDERDLGGARGALLLIAAEGSREMQLVEAPGAVLAYEVVGYRRKGAVAAALVLRPGESAVIRDGESVRRFECREVCGCIIVQEAG